MTKRRIFAIISILFSASLFFTSIATLERRILLSFLFAFLLSLGVILALGFSLRSARVSKFFPLLTLPFLLILGSNLTFYFFPNFSLFFKIAFISLSIFIFYTILLAINVFGVVKEREEEIPLLRAARTTSLLGTLFTTFLIFTLLYKAELNFGLQILGIFLFAFFLGFSYFWAQTIKLSGEVLKIVFLLSLGVGEIAFSLSFLPLKSFFRSILLTTAFYVILGFLEHLLKHTLTKKVVAEYFFVALLVALILLVL